MYVVFKLSCTEFIAQTGDSTGTGEGGESIYGHTFKVSSAGPCLWLDLKSEQWLFLNLNYRFGFTFIRSIHILYIFIPLFVCLSARMSFILGWGLSGEGWWGWLTLAKTTIAVSFSSLWAEQTSSLTNTLSLARWVGGYTALSGVKLKLGHNKAALFGMGKRAFRDQCEVTDCVTRECLSYCGIVHVCYM